jgi:hypothetical protein
MGGTNRGTIQVIASEELCCSLRCTLRWNAARLLSGALRRHGFEQCGEDHRLCKRKGALAAVAQGGLPAHRGVLVSHWAYADARPEPLLTSMR